MSQINDILSKLNSLKSEEKIPVKLPSTNKSVEFSPLNVKQQKNLLKQTLGGVMSLPELLAEFNEIVIESCKNGEVELMVYDRYPVLLELRKNAYGNTITVDGTKYDITSLPEAGKVSTGLNEEVVTYKSISVKLKTPSLKSDTAFIKKSASENRKNKVDDEKEVISGMYVLEIAKYIDLITFDEEELKFQSIPFAEKIKIVENLPASLNQKILTFIAKVREFENKMITFEDGTILPIDSLFATQE